MRVLIIGTALLMSSALVPSLAQEQQKSPVANQPPTTAVQPERSPQQSEQSREQDRRAAEDVQVGRDWRAQQQRSPRSDQPSMTVVQPERSPQQSERSREQDRRSAEDVQVGRDWRAQQRDGERMGRIGQGRIIDENDLNHRTVGRNWQMQRDDERSYYDEARPRSRVKICTVYENGDEFCRYRN
jgi:hypothetical protein